MDKIVWQLDADTSRVGVQMEKAVASVNRGTAGMSTGFGNATKSADKFLESNNRVTNQVAGFTRSLLSSRGAIDAVATGMDRLENSLNLSLAAGIALAAGGVILGKFGELKKEYEALDKALNQARENASRSGDFKGLAEIESQAKAASAAVNDLADRMDARSGKKGFWSSAWQATKDVAYDVFTGSAIENTDTTAKNEGMANVNELTQQGYRRRRQQTGLQESALSGTPDYEIQAAKQYIEAQERAAKGLDEAAQTFREMNVALSALLQKRNDKAMERSGRSLTEIAESAPDVVNNSGGGAEFVSYEQWANSQQAKKALRLKGQAEAAKAAGNPDMAHDLFNQSDEAAQGVTGLKPSEKMSADFKGALQVTEEQLRIIAENTAGKLVNK